MSDATEVLSARGPADAADDDSASNSAAGARSRSGAQARLRKLTWWFFDLMVPLVVFLIRVGGWTLDPLAAPRMMRYDWVTYIVAPNYLRSAPLLTWPIGRVQNYIAPVGSSLGLSDATPILTPVYRLVNAIWPDRPVQLLGWLVLVAYVLLYVCIVKFLAAMRCAVRGGNAIDLVGKLEIRLVAAMMLFVPFFQDRLSHIALMQQWILVAALYVAVFRSEPSRRNTRLSVGVVILSAVMHPYFVPAVMVINVPYLLRLYRRRSPRAAITATAAMLAGTAVASVMLGYVGGGANASNGGYGLYSADLSFLVSPHDTSHLLRPLSFAPDTWENLGFVGLGCLFLIVSALAVTASGLRLPSSLKRPLGWTVVTTACLAVFATFPVIHFAGHTIVDLSDTIFSLEFVGKIMRSNGRFIWSFGWLVSLVAAGIIVSIRHKGRLFVSMSAVALQFTDVRPNVLPQSDPALYRSAASVLRDEANRGATSVQIMPPEIVYACLSEEINYDHMAPVLLAASVIGVPVNSGFPGRSSSRFLSEICQQQTQEFVAGTYHPDVVYVVNQVRIMPPNFSCRPLTGSLVACRSAPT